MKKAFIIVLCLLFTSCGFYRVVVVQNKTNQPVIFKYYFKDSTLSFDIPPKECVFHDPPFFRRAEIGIWKDSLIDLYLSNIEKIEIQKDHDTIRYNGKDAIKGFMKKRNSSTIIYRIK